MIFDWSDDEFHYWQRDTISPGLSKRSVRLQWLDPDTEVNYAHRGNRYYSPDDVQYDINSLGYRSREPTPEPTSIAVFGCSNTFGLGLPLEETWPYLLEQRLREDGYSCFVHNFGLPGHGSDTIAMLVPQVISVIIILHSALARRTYYPTTHSRHLFLPTSKRTPDDPFYAIDRSFQNLSTDANDFYLWVRNQRLIETACKVSATECLWSLCFDFDVQAYSFDILQKYVDVTDYCGRATIDPEYYCDPVMLARDGAHAGRDAHVHLAREYFDHIVGRKLIK